MSNTVLIQAPAGVSQVVGVQTGQAYVPDANGQFLCDPMDVGRLVLNGFILCVVRMRMYLSAAVASANAALLFASAALSNGTKAVAAQVDVPRQVQAVVNPGTLAITAGNLALTYTANDGTTVTDNFNLITALSTNLTMQSSKGVLHMTSQIVTGLVGGATPGIQIGTNATLAVPVDPGAEGISFLKENLDGADSTIGTPGVNGLIAPNTAPNATHTYGWGYKFTAAG